MNPAWIVRRTVKRMETDCQNKKNARAKHLPKTLLEGHKGEQQKFLTFNECGLRYPVYPIYIYIAISRVLKLYFLK